MLSSPSSLPPPCPSLHASHPPVPRPCGPSLLIVLPLALLLPHTPPSDRKENLEGKLTFLVPPSFHPLPFHSLHACLPPFPPPCCSSLPVPPLPPCSYSSPFRPRRRAIRMSALLRSLFFFRSPNTTSAPSAPSAPRHTGQAARAHQTNQTHRGTFWPPGEQGAASTPGIPKAHLAHQAHRHAKHDRTPNTPCTSGTPRAHAATQTRATDGETSTGSLQDNDNIYPQDRLQNAPRQQPHKCATRAQTA